MGLEHRIHSHKSTHICFVIFLRTSNFDKTESFYDENGNFVEDRENGTLQFPCYDTGVLDDETDGDHPQPDVEDHIGARARPVHPVLAVQLLDLKIKEKWRKLKNFFSKIFV